MTADLGLSRVAEVIRGVSYEKADAHCEAASGLVPILRAGNIADDLDTQRDLVWVPKSRVQDEQLLRKGDVAICMSSGSAAVVGKTAICDADWHGSIGAFCALIRCRDVGYLPRFLYYFLRSPRFRSWTQQASGVNIKNIRKSELEHFPVPDCHVKDQRRIVDSLSRAEGIIRLQREGAHKARQITPSVFLDMFGDPATNPKAWPTRSLNALISSGPQNGLYKPASAYGDGTPIVRIDSFYDGSITDLPSLRRVRLDQHESERFALRTGDILLNRVNSPVYLGKSALVPNMTEPTVFESNMMRFSVDDQQANSAWLIHFLQTNRVKAHWLSRAKHAINQSSINQGDVGSLVVPLPPIPLQIQFVEAASAVRGLESLQSKAYRTAEDAFGALLAKYFD